MAHFPRGRRLWQILAGSCAALALFSGIMLARELSRAAAERENNRALARQRAEAAQSAAPFPGASQGSPEAGAEEQEAEKPPLRAPSGRLPAYDALWQENPDLAGWLIAEGLDANLPVMYTPEEPEAYLHRAFDGSYASSGCLFLGEGWEPEGNYAVIYGHNMRDGTMFGRLDAYRTLEYARAHPTLRFDTLTEERTYTVFAAFYSRVYNEDDGEESFRYYQYTSLEDPAVFQEFLRRVREAALYDTGAEVREDSRILVLSTCSYHQKDGRFVVVACEGGSVEGDG